jgi:hypothetical protein
MSVFVRGHRAVMAGMSLAALACLSPLHLSASQVVVGNCKNLVQFSTIQAAVDASPSGSTAYICPGTYPEQVVITKNFTLTGVSALGTSGANASGANNPVITSRATGMVANANDLYDGSGIAAQIAVLTPITASSPIAVNINNLAVNGSNNLISGCGPDLVGIYYQNASGTINHVSASNQALSADLGGCQSGLAIFVQSGYASGGTGAVTIQNSSVHSYQKNGITADGSGMVAAITGNYVVGQGATPVIAQNGIQVSDGATGKVSNNTVTDDVYISPNGGPYYSASGILLYDSGGSSAKSLTVSGNTVSNTQGGIVTYGDTYGTADYNVITSNKVTASPAAGPYLIDGIDLCSNNNTATSNIVFNSSGAGIHIDSQCTESTGPSGNNTSVSTNTINDACAGVLSGNGTGNPQSGNITYNVVQVTLPGDSCPLGLAGQRKGRLKPLPWRP